MDVPLARASADLRFLRAAVFTAACVALSAGAHIVGGGAKAGAPPMWTLGVASLLVFAVAAPLAGRERSLPGIAAGLALGQFALHGLFSFGETLSHARSGDDGHRVIGLARSLLCNDGLVHGLTVSRARQILDDAGLGHLAHGAGSTAGTTGASGLGEPSGADAAALAAHGALSALAPPMLLGHVAAALAIGLLLRRGEAAMWRLVRLSAVAVDQLLLRALRDVLHWLCTPGSEDEDEHGIEAAGHARLFTPAEATALRHSVVRRGPPRRACDYELTA